MRQICGYSNVLIKKHHVQTKIKILKNSININLHLSKNMIKNLNTSLLVLTQEQTDINNNLTK